MGQALSGFAIIWSVIAVGWLLAHVRVVGRDGQVFLNRMAFLVASPALLFTIVGKGSLDHLFSTTLIASLSAILVTAGVYLAANALWFRNGLAPSTIGWMCAAYTNAGNLGLPIALHLLGDMTWVAPIMLLQVGILQPFALACLDVAEAREKGVRLSPARYLTLPVRNPITVGIILGLVVNLTRVPIPEWIASATQLVGGMAVPMMLLAFGVSLRLDPLPGTGPHAREVWFVQLLKLLVMPGVAIGVGAALGLKPHDLFAVGVIAALPTAQNVFVISSRYRVHTPVARDSVFWATILTIPVIVLLAAVLG